MGRGRGPRRPPRIPDAPSAAQRAYDPDGLGFSVWVLPERIEAAVRSSEPGTAAGISSRGELRDALPASSALLLPA